MPMELVVILFALVVLDVLALLFSYDSRAKIQSKEEELACFGLTWANQLLPRPIEGQ